MSALCLSRTTWAILAGLSMPLTVIVGNQIADGPLKVLFATMSWGIITSTGAAALALAERFDLLAPPYREPALGLAARLREGAVPPKRRGGWRPSLRLWPTQRVFAHYALVVDFLKRVAAVEPHRCFISDGLTLWDVHDGPSNEPFFRRAEHVYGVDISDIDPPYLWAIAQRIQERRPH